jgi:hypothetical protein
MISDADHLANIEALTDTCEDAIRRGYRMVTFELSPIAWLAIFDEIRNRRRANYSALIADQHVRDMNEALDRMHDEIVYLVAYGPRRNVTDAMAMAGPTLGEVIERAHQDRRS